MLRAGNFQESSIYLYESVAAQPIGSHLQSHRLFVDDFRLTPVISDFKVVLISVINTEVHFPLRDLFKKLVLFSAHCGS
jgi:hypothetical protein